MSNETNAKSRLLETLNEIKASVRAAATKKKGKTLVELVDMILDALQEHTAAVSDAVWRPVRRSPSGGLP